MSKRSDKMYANSPKIEAGEDGKKVVTKGEKVAAKTDAGTEGMALTELSQKHSKERLALHHKHELDHAELHAKHLKEGSTAEEKSESAVEEKNEKKAEKA